MSKSPIIANVNANVGAGKTTVCRQISNARTVVLLEPVDIYEALTEDGVDLILQC
jgi:adenylate kinase family enzyme